MAAAELVQRKAVQPAAHAAVVVPVIPVVLAPAQPAVQPAINNIVAAPAPAPAPVPAPAAVAPPMSVGMATVCIIVLLVSGVCRDVGAIMMGYVMPVYAAWLLYFTTIMYTLLFLTTAWYMNQWPFSNVYLTRPQVRQYLILGSWTAANGLFFQFAQVWVDAHLQQVLGNLRVPLVLLLARFVYFPAQLYTRRAWCGCVMVCAGIAIGIVPAINALTQTTDQSLVEQSDHWYWVVAFLVSVVFAALIQVQEQQAFENVGCAVVPTLFWYNLVSVPFYLLTIFLESVPYLNGTTDAVSVSDAIQNQANAFRCYMGQPTATDIQQGHCLSESWLWPTVFMVGYAVSFFMNAHATQRYGAVFTNVLGSLVSPLSAAVFMSPQIVGAANQQPGSWWLLASFLTIVAGILWKG